MRARLSRAEWVKLGCLAATLALVAAEGVAPAGVLCLGAVHVGTLLLAGYCLLCLSGRRVPASPADALAVCYVLGWSALGFFGVAARVHGRVGVEIPLLLALATAVVLIVQRRRRGAEDGDDVPVPWGIYLLTAGYVALSVALPLSFFSAASIGREFYGDGVQRFGVIYALADRVPPLNPFMAGAPLRYYWLGMLPYAAEVRWIWPDLFDVWKSGQTWTGMLMLPALWYFVRSWSGERRVATWALLFAFVFTSWEWLAHPVWRHGLARLLDDPDMALGIVQPWSDQLLTEDFLYVPHNAWALMMVLGSAWLLSEGRLLGALPGLCAVAAVNTFYALPVGVGYATVALAQWRPQRALPALLALVGLTVALMAVVGILPPIGLWGLLAPVLAWATARGRDATAREAERWLPGAVWALLGALAFLLATNPLQHTEAYLLNYGPAAVGGVALLVGFARRRETCDRPQLATALLFLLSAAATVLFVTAVLELGHVDWLPAGWTTRLLALGDVLNPFNFYHKTAKLVRLTWALLAALLLAPVFGTVARRARRVPLLVAAIVLLSAVPVTIWRPLTYTGHCPVPEAAAAAWLRQQHLGMDTVILVENYRGTALNMLAPVSVYCYSQWGQGNLGLSTRRGTWLDQYLPEPYRPQSRARELAVERFFGAAMTTPERREFLRVHGVRYVLARRPWPAASLAQQVCASAGEYLYVVTATGGQDTRP